MVDCIDPGPPSFAGFIDFVRNVMGITTAQLPDDSAWLTLAYCSACAIIYAVPEATGNLLLQQATYNLAGSTLLNVAQDSTPVVPYPPNSDSTVGFFAYTRQRYNMLGFVSGVIQAAADEATSESMVVPEAFKELTLANLQQIKDPYGRAYLSIVQSFGPSVWGLT